MFSYEEIKELVKLVNENNIGSIEIKSANGDSIEIKGKSDVVSVAPKAILAENAAEASQKLETQKKEEAPKKTFNSPIVGTFYSAADPSAKPFVTNGSVVKKGDLLCIIEAMKIMNEVKADFDGKISNVLVQNGDAVEYDQPLFEIE